MDSQDFNPNQSNDQSTNKPKFFPGITGVASNDPLVSDPKINDAINRASEMLNSEAPAGAPKEAPAETKERSTDSDFSEAAEHIKTAANGIAQTFASLLGSMYGLGLVQGMADASHAVMESVAADVWGLPEIPVDCFNLGVAQALAAIQAAKEKANEKVKALETELAKDSPINVEKGINIHFDSSDKTRAFIKEILNNPEYRQTHWRQNPTTGEFEQYYPNDERKPTEFKTTFDNDLHNHLADAMGYATSNPYLHELAKDEEFARRRAIVGSAFVSDKQLREMSRNDFEFLCKHGVTHEEFLKKKNDPQIRNKFVLPSDDPELKNRLETLQKKNDAERASIKRPFDTITEEEFYRKTKEEYDNSYAYMAIPNGLNIAAKRIHKTAIEKGWWEDELENGQTRNDAECIALMHSELSEALDALRSGEQVRKNGALSKEGILIGKRSEHIPDFLAIEEEYADTIIRILDHAERRGWNVADAVVAKMKYNQTRPYKHGGKRF
jgi:hypothetical protein